MKKEKKYKLKNIRLMLMQAWYGKKIFCLPILSKLKNRAFRRAFNIDEGLYIEFNNRFYREHGLEGHIKIGKHFCLTNNVIIDYSGSVEIGNNVTISSGCKIYSHDHNYTELKDKKVMTAIPGNITIEDNVWIGAGSIILSNVTIHSGSVIGAGSVVTHDVPCNSIAAGNPARIIKQID